MADKADIKTDDQIAEIVETIDDIRNEDVKTVGSVIERLGVASFSPVLLFVSLVIITPLSGVPGLSSVCGFMIVLVSGQLLLGRDELWLPNCITRRRLPGRKLDKPLAQIKPPLRWVQEKTTRRLAFLTTAPVSYMLYTICLLCGAAMPFLELVPMTSTLLALVVALLAISLISRDGVFTLLGFTALATTGALFLTLRELFA